MIVFINILEDYKPHSLNSDFIINFASVTPPFFGWMG